MILDDYGMAETLAKKAWSHFKLDQVVAHVKSKRFLKIKDRPVLRGHLTDLASNLPSSRRFKLASISYVLATFLQSAPSPWFLAGEYDFDKRQVAIAYHLSPPEPEPGESPDELKDWLLRQLDFRVLATTCRHEITHALRHADKGFVISKELRRRANQSVNDMSYWYRDRNEQDALVHEVAEMKSLSGKYWDDMSLSELLRVLWKLDHYVTDDKLRPRMLGRLVAEDLLGRKAKKELEEVGLLDMAPGKAT